MPHIDSARSPDVIASSDGSYLTVRKRLLDEIFRDLLMANPAGDGDPCAWWDEAGHKLAEVLRMQWDDEAACPRTDRVIVRRAIASDAAYWLEGLAPLVSDDEDRSEPLAYARALRAAAGEGDTAPGRAFVDVTPHIGQIIPTLAIRSRVRVDGWGETVYRIWHLGTGYEDGNRDLALPGSLDVHMGLVEVDEAEPVPPAVSEMDSIEAARADLQDQMGRDELPRAETGLCPEPDDGGHACSLPLRPFYASVADATSAPVLWACATGHILYAARPL